LAAETTFDSTKQSLEDILKDIKSGKIHDKANAADAKRTYG